VKVPPEFDTVVEAFVTPANAPGGAITAFVLAFGGFERRCFAYVFTTSATGPGAEQAVGERLGAMVQGSLEKIGWSGELEQRVLRPSAFPEPRAPER